MEAARILVVDDAPELAAIVAEFLAANGAVVETASNGRMALEKLQQHPYDAIVSDLQMPELDGPGLYGAVARHYPHLCPRIIFMTSGPASPEAEAWLAQIGGPVLRKPFSLVELRRVVQQVLAGRDR